MKRKRFCEGIAVLSIVAMQFCIFQSNQNTSATLDEQVYVLAGVGIQSGNGFCFKRDATPLLPRLSSFFGAAFKKDNDGWNFEENFATSAKRIREFWLEKSYESRREYYVAAEFFKNNNGVELIHNARYCQHIFSVILAVTLFLFSRELFGDFGGMTSVFLLSFGPNIIGHSAVVSADMPLSSLFLAAHYGWFKYEQSNKWQWMLFTSIAVAICIAVKLSGVLVVASISIIAIANSSKYFLAKPTVEASRNVKGKLRQLVLVLLLSSLCFTVVISILHGSIRGVVDHINAFGLIYTNVQRPYFSYLNGGFGSNFWQYYFIALGVKTPLIVLVLFLAGIWGICLGDSSRVLRLNYCIVPIVIVLGISAFDAINIGIRRVLPVLPFMYLTIGGAVLAAFNMRNGLKKLGFSVCMSIFLTLHFLQCVSTHPNHLSYFNYAVGGPENGYLFLAESNVSWGQSLPQLAIYLEEIGAPSVRMDFYGYDDPYSYGIESERISEMEIRFPIQTNYVVSAHKLVYRDLLLNNEKLNWLDRDVPMVRLAGGSLFLFDFSNYPEMSDRTAEQSLVLARSFVADDKPEKAIVFFQHYLLENPDDKLLHRELAIVADEIGHFALARHHRMIAADSEVR